jgi:ATP-dependent exoDNAse (exonuclease V) beta subunit
VVVRRERGKPSAAAIYDFKTDRDGDAERLRQRYAEQLELYREVVAGLLGLAVARVECRLVATAEGSLVGI